MASSSKADKGNALWRYAFTWKKIEDGDHEKLIKWCKKETKKWVFQEEKGASGFPHYQGSIKLKEKLRMSTLVNKTKALFPGIH